MKVAVLQTAPRFGEVRANLDRIFELGAGLRAELVVLPELCTTGYQFRDRAELCGLAEPADGPSLGRLAELARAVGGAVVAGFAERAGDALYNSAALVRGAGPVEVYRKVHLFDRERELFAPGADGFGVFDLGPVRLGLMICFDWIFPEAARSLALAGAQLIAHPANLVLPWCQQAMPVRALENRVFSLTANRVGAEARWPDQPLRFTGASLVAGPDGRVLARAEPEGEQLLEVELDPDRALDKRVTPRNDLLADRRPRLYRLG